MPKVKGMRLPKWKAQPPVPNTPIPVRKHRRQAGYGDMVKPVTWYSGYIGAVSSLPVVPPNAQRDLWFMRREPPVSDGRIHTPGHKPQSVVTVSACGTRSRHLVHCHDRQEEID